LVAEQFFEDLMFITIRRYSPKNGSINRASLELLRRQIQEDFLPQVERIQGFRAFYMVGVDDRELMTLTVCDNQEGVAEYERLAADYTLRNPLIFELGRPDVTAGHVLSCTEANDPATAALALWIEQSRGMLLSASQQ
jgi:hypothetical protein